MFRDTVTSYISKCVNAVVITMTVKSVPNQKSWMDGEVRALFRANIVTFQLGDKEAYNATKAGLKACIKAETSVKKRERLKNKHTRDMCN